jgi:hypothetical protein
MVSETVSPLIVLASGREWQVRQYWVMLPFSFRARVFLIPWDPWQEEQSGASFRVNALWCNGFAVNWRSSWQFLQEAETLARNWALEAYFADG